MDLLQEMNFNEVIIQKLSDEYLKDKCVQVNVLRLDKIHPVVSGNKWFKLKYYLREAIEKNYSSVGTFGGAFSNHILATAYACNKQNLQCTGFIRGEAAKDLSQTLLDAESLNMQLQFISRSDYKNKQAIPNANPAMFFVPEGGYGETGVKGVAEILQLVPDLSTYDYIVCAVGTGTMQAGIANAALSHQQCIGISVMKNNKALEKETKFLMTDEAQKRVQLLHDYHFGGYAKCTQALIDFMNKQWTLHHLPLDFVYTAKALYAVYDLAEKKYFNDNSSILFIHSGGLQGNRSLKEGTLLYR
ncbi:MAG TPA: pyridoxal-phosphate dependent enzyme [Parafilimonas sp.]|nr:pyridoxal-phosphate dependent enzyme [Parafilimonas sp.]